MYKFEIPLVHSTFVSTTLLQYLWLNNISKMLLTSLKKWEMFIKVELKL